MSSVGPLEPNHRDIAEFLRLCLEYRLLPATAVKDWAFDLVLRHDIPPPWLCDLTLEPIDSID